MAVFHTVLHPTYHLLQIRNGNKFISFFPVSDEMLLNKLSTYRRNLIWSDLIWSHLFWYRTAKAVGELPAVELRTHAQRKLFTDVSSSPSFSTWSATKFVLLLAPSRLSTSSILHVMLKLMQFEVRALETEGVTMSTKTEMTRLAGVALLLLLFLSPLPLIILLFSSLRLCLRFSCAW